MPIKIGRDANQKLAEMPNKIGRDANQKTATDANS